MASSPTLQRIATDSSLALLFRILHVAMGYLTTLAIARYYGAGTMGTYYIALSLAQTIWTFCCLGLNTGLLRFVAVLKSAGKNAELRQLFWTAVKVVALLGCIAGVALWGLGHRLAESFHSPNLPSVLNFMALWLPLGLVGALLSETVRALGGVRWTVLFQDTISPAFFLFLILVFAYAGPNLISPEKALGLAYLSLAFLGLGFLALLQQSRRFLIAPAPGLLHGTETGSPPLKELIRYSWPLFLTSILWLYSAGLDSLVLGYFSSPEIVAYYGAAARTALLVSFPLLAVNAVVSPLFAQYHEQGNLEGLGMVSQTTARWMYLVALPLALLLILLGPELLRLFGPDFPKARFAMSALVMAQLVNVAVGSVGYLLMMTGNQWTLLVMQIIIGVGIIPIIVVSGAFFGLNGVALASASGIVLINILMAWGVWRRLKIKSYARGVTWANLGAFLGIALFFLSKPYLGVLGGATLFAFGYLTMAGKTLAQEIRNIFGLSQSVRAIR
jgi:O-antigen/teichoic acid export membrane protein